MFGSINKPTGPLPCRKLLSRLRIASQTDDIGVVWRQWSTTFLEAMKLSIPHKFVSTKSSTLWVDRHIRQEISRHEQFYRMFKCSSKQDWLVKYKYLRNKVTNMISSAKKAYFETLAGTTTNTRNFDLLLDQYSPEMPPFPGHCQMTLLDLTLMKTKPIS